MPTARIRSIVLVSILALSGCAAAHYEKVEWATRVQQPPPGTSLVYFIRPGPPTWGNATILDNHDYVGTLPTWGHIAYIAKPGKHLFVVVSEAADFLEADLEAGKTYYANVRRRMGYQRPRYSFVAHVDARSIDAAQELVNTTPQLIPNEVGRKAFERKRGRFQWMRNRSYPVWEKNKSKQVLTAACGR